MNKKDIENFKKKLEAEQKVLLTELAATGRKNPDHPGDWEPVATDLNIPNADENEVADKMESFQENQSAMNEFEKRYNEVKAALGRIKTGNYGICKICKKVIEIERLEANPAAQTCIEHEKM